MAQKRNFKQALGPGLILAGTSIGASHLVQSTRAGVMFGLMLVSVVIFANVVKYPAFSFAPRYSAATGLSLVVDYRRQGLWAMGCFVLATALTVFTATAGVAIVSSGLLIALFELSISPFVGAFGVMLTCLMIILIGGFTWLDRVMKVSLLLLTFGTLAAVIAILPTIDFSGPYLPSVEFFQNKTSLFFVMALIGWMPAPIDASVWHSLWCVAKQNESKSEVGVLDALLDFNIGYIGTALLGICFVILGAAVMHSGGEGFPSHPVLFAGRIIELYVDALGAWARPVLGGAAFLVMFSTTLSIIDGGPRAIVAMLDAIRQPNDKVLKPFHRRQVSWGMAIIIHLGALLILSRFSASLPGLIDIATIVGLLTAPLFGVLNHRAVFSKEFPKTARPSNVMRVCSGVCIAVMAFLAIVYAATRLS